MKRLRAGSRESLLAVVQTETVMDAVRTWYPTIHIELVTMKTTGDKILDRTLDKVGGKGLFVKELDAALLDGQVDFTVHSCKDLPMELDPRLPLAGFSHREDPRDALVLPLGVGELDPTKPIGCASGPCSSGGCSPGSLWRPCAETSRPGLESWTRDNMPRWYWRQPASGALVWRSGSHGISQRRR